MSMSNLDFSSPCLGHLLSEIHFSAIDAVFTADFSPSLFKDDAECGFTDQRC